MAIISNIMRIRVPSARKSMVSSVNATIHRIDSVKEKTINSIQTSLTNKIDIFSQSHLRIIPTIELAICSLLRLLDNYGILLLIPLAIATSMILTASIIMVSSLLETLALSEIIIAIATLTVTIATFALLMTSRRLAESVSEKLVQKHLDRSVDINKLTETLLKLDTDFVTALNEWTRHESCQADSQWQEARKNIINFYTTHNLTTLSLEHFNLYSLPNVFNNATFRNRLKTLFIYNNRLLSVPESIGNLQSLTHLKLADNSQLAALPESILQLPPTCVVDINNCNFSPSVLARMREIVNNPNYIGPQFSHSMRNSFPQVKREPSMEESLKNFYRISGRNYNGLPQLNKIPHLRRWLHKLTWVADFKGGTQRTFVTKVIEYLERANKDDAFREVFAATISDATESCGDRVALSVLNLGIAYKLSIIDLKNMHELYHLLNRGILALDLLQDIARQKISTLRLVDEIEVYLGYPMKLKESLNLPIDIESMLFFKFSALSSQDIENAKNSVLNSLKNEDMQIAFLKTQPKWIDALQVNYPKEMERIAENPDLAEEGLINLTKQVIQSFNS